MSTIVARFASALGGLPLTAGDGAVVAVSGGADSLALADLLHRTRESHRLALTIGHVDHGIHPSSGTVAASVERFALRRGLPFAAAHLGLGAGASETIARSARYAALEQLRRSAGARWIVTAHHADDQAETVLMRLLHGSGPAGLAGMSPVRGRILRPLLGFARAELIAYAAERELDGWEDPSNADVRHERAWLREAVLPLLRDRIPDVTARITRSARQAAADRAAWDALLDSLPALAVARDPAGISVAAPPLAGYDSRLASALVRALGRRAGIVIGPRRADQVVDLARSGRSGSSLPLGGDARAEIAFGRLRLVAAGDPTTAAAVLALGDSRAGDARWGRWSLRWSTESAPGEQPRNGMTAWFVPTPELRVREWQPGDRLRPIGGTGRRLLVRCFQDAQVPRSRRAEWPVVESDGQVVWAPGVCRGAGLVPEAGSEALRVDVAYA
jgi:tRNA(Ile)-lysidine synthase